MGAAPALTPWALAADALLALHGAIVLFVVGGLLYVWAGYRHGWPGARPWALRLAHAAAIGIVAAQAWLGRLLHWDAPPWVFTAAYTLFGLAVLATWWRLPPRRRGG